MIIRLYGHVVPNTPIDVLSWRVIALGGKPDLALPRGRADAGTARDAAKGHRLIYLPNSRAFGDVPVYDRYALAAGTQLDGPAIIEERESTVVINGFGAVQVDQWNNLIVDLG